MRKFILLALAMVAIVPMTLLAAAPAGACVAGYSPGYWKNHTGAWAATGFSTGELYTVALDITPPAGSYLAAHTGLTLLEALQLGYS